MPEFVDAQALAEGALAEGDVAWRTSRRGNPKGSCVEVAPLADGGVAVRHSRHRAGPVLVYTRAEMTAFILGAKDGDFDDLLAEGA
jgi:hypothetical protein